MERGRRARELTCLFAMRITLSIDGGLASFPGLRQPKTLDVSALSGPERDHVCALVDAVRHDLGHPNATGRPLVSRPDTRTYTLAIDDAGACHTIHLTEPVEDVRFAALLHSVRMHLAR